MRLLNMLKKAGERLAASEVNDIVDLVNEHSTWINNYEATHGSGKDMSLAVVVGVNGSYIYTGEPIVPDFRVYMGGNLLTYREDYDYDISDNTEIGTGKITLYGIGSLTGQKVITFAIEGKKYNVAYRTAHAQAPAARKLSVFTDADLPVLTDEDYSFIGWYDAQNNEYIAGSILTKDVELIAKWQAKTFTLTYITAHGEVTQPTSKLAAVPTLPQPIAEGYKFEGWYYENGVQAQQGDTLRADTTLTAKWVDTSFYNILTINDETKEVKLSFEAGEKVEEVRVQYSTDNGASWETPTEPITLTETKTYITRVMYNGAAINEISSITCTYDADAEGVGALTFTSENGDVKNKATNENVGTIDLNTFTGNIEITDGVKNASIVVTNN